MICPYCLQTLNARSESCLGCKREMPALYVRHHNGWLARDPVKASVIGFLGHGKTVYLSALFHALENDAARAWPQFYRQALNQESANLLHENLRRLRAGDLPQKTKLVFPEPSIHRLAAMPRFNDRTVLFYDPPGEAFNEDAGVQKFAHYVTGSECVLFLISLADMDVPVYQDMHRLLETYTLGLSRMRAYRPYSQHLVVVYTKADLLTTRFSLPEAAVEYLLQQEVGALTDIDAYLQGMYQQSDALARFTAATLEAHGFINLAHNHFRSIQYCAVSALGSQPTNGRLSLQIAPRRVLDPLLWVLERSQRRWL